MIKIQAFYDFYSRLSKNEKKLFYCAALFASLALFDLLIVSPVFNKIRSLNQEISEKTSAIKKYLHILSQKERISEETAKFGYFLSALKSNEEEITILLKEIENLADKSSVYLVDMKPQDSKGSQNKFSVSLSCEAQMEQLVQFMHSIESSDKILTVDRYEITQKSKESTIVQCSMSVSKIVKL